jgi:hypothetical protein
MYICTDINITELFQEQGDQIGRIFACWVIVGFIGQFFTIMKLPIFLSYFLPRQKNFVVIFKKMGWAAFWEILKQTHQEPMFWFFNIFAEIFCVKIGVFDSKQSKV